jgi:hypothetical protein
MALQLVVSQHPQSTLWMCHKTGLLCRSQADAAAAWHMLCIALHCCPAIWGLHQWLIMCSLAPCCCRACCPHTSTPHTQPPPPAAAVCGRRRRWFCSCRRSAEPGVCSPQELAGAACGVRPIYAPGVAGEVAMPPAQQHAVQHARVTKCKYIMCLCVRYSVRDLDRRATLAGSRNRQAHVSCASDHATHITWLILDSIRAIQLQGMNLELST